MSFDVYLGCMVSWVCGKMNFGMLWGCDAIYGYYVKYEKWLVRLRFMLWYGYNLLKVLIL